MLSYKKTNSKQANLEENYIKDVDKLADKKGRGIDDYIKPLIQALWDTNYETNGSCEGHLDHGRGYPYVDLLESENGKDNILRLETILHRYNKRVSDKSVRWGLKKGILGSDQHVGYELRPVKGKDTHLEDAKSNILPLADFIKTAIDNPQYEKGYLANKFGNALAQLKWGLGIRKENLSMQLSNLKTNMEWFYRRYFTKK